MPISPQEFVLKWRGVALKERSAAYGWPADLADEEILERLLALNLQRAGAIG